jgi:hypothetical protein
MSWLQPSWTGWPGAWPTSSRSTSKLKAKGVAPSVLAMQLDTTTPTGKLMLQLMGCFAEVERDVMLERRREGVARAKPAGKYVAAYPTAQRNAAEVVQLRGRRNSDHFCEGVREFFQARERGQRLARCQGRPYPASEQSDSNPRHHKGGGDKSGDGTYAPEVSVRLQINGNAHARGAPTNIVADR